MRSLPKYKMGVVVPTFNSAVTLPWTLCALRAQREVTLDILVADSGSEDDTLAICKVWGIRTIYVPPGNMYRAINAGLKHINAEWITYLNSDDVVYSRSYARLIEQGEHSNAAAVYGDGDYIDHEGRFLYAERSASPSWLPGMFRCGRLGFQQPACIFRRCVFEELGGFDEQFRLIADYDLFYRLICSDHKIAKLPPPSVTAFRLHSSQFSFREATNIAHEMSLFRRNTYIKPSLRDALDVFFWRAHNSFIYVGRLLRGQLPRQRYKTIFETVKRSIVTWDDPNCEPR